MRSYFFKKIKSKKGQSVVEFVSVIMIVFFFLLFFLSLSFTLVLSQYMDYATFMAARTYKASHSSPENQREKARRVFNSYVQWLNNNALLKSISELEFIAADPGGRSHQSEGVRVTYEVNLFYLPPLFAKDRLSSTLTLTSESFLGRDPTFQECKGFFRDFTRRIGFTLNSSDLDKMEDNGC